MGDHMLICLPCFCITAPALIGLGIYNVATKRARRGRYFEGDEAVAIGWIRIVIGIVLLGIILAYLLTDGIRLFNHYIIPLL